jgi:hypothetical protein
MRGCRDAGMRNDDGLRKPLPPEAVLFRISPSPDHRKDSIASRLAPNAVAAWARVSLSRTRETRK